MSWHRLDLGSPDFVHDILKLKKKEKTKQEIYERVTNEPEYKDKKRELEEETDRLRQKIQDIKSLNLKTAAKHWQDVRTFAESTTLVLWLVILMLHACRIVVVVLFPELFLECVFDEGTFEPSRFGTNFYLSWSILFGEYPCLPVYMDCTAIDD